MQIVRKEYVPRRYQTSITQHVLNRPRCNIWGGMGVGKTVSVLTALDILINVGSYDRKVLVLAPYRVATGTWLREAYSWYHLRNLRVRTLCGNANQRIEALRSSYDVATLNYENIPWLIETLGEHWPFGMVIADESVLLKNYRVMQGGKRARLLGNLAFSRVDRWVNLTGEPAPNGYEDLWGQTWFLDRGRRLGTSYQAYQDRYFCWKRDPNLVSDRNARPKLSLQPYAKELINESLSDITIAVRAKDYMDLPPLIENIVEVELPAKARTLYKSMQRDMFMDLDGIGVDAFNAASKTMKCLQLAAGAVYPNTDSESRDWIHVHDAKLDALESVINEAAGMPVLVGYWWQSDLTRLQKRFPQGRHLDKKPQTEDDWNAGKIPLLFAQTKSAGHGLNLQFGGNILVYFSLWWDLDPHSQILERIGPTRQFQSGLNRSVFVHYLIARKTVDEAVHQRLKTKKGVGEVLMEYMSQNR